LRVAELQRGVYRILTLRLYGRLDWRFCCAVCQCCRSTPLAALAYGRIIAQCGWARGLDYVRMIAAHAISSTSILVTNNKADFRDIPSLSMENWLV
jgi:tRNA(fMet)-specific endonuclease VapC